MILLAERACCGTNNNPQLNSLRGLQSSSNYEFITYIYINMSEKDKFDNLRFTHLPRIHTVEERIAKSERFPRIRDAAASVKKKQQALRDRIDERDRLREEARLLRLANGTDGEESIAGDDPTVKKVPLVQEDEIENGFFTAHVLNEDPEMSKFVDYDALVYPKPYEVVKLPPEFIDKMWVAGFMDRANRDGPAKMKAEQNKMAKARKNKFKISENSSQMTDEDTMDDAPFRLASDTDKEEEEAKRAEQRARTEKMLKNLMKQAARNAGKEVSDSDEEEVDENRSIHSLGTAISGLESTISVDERIVLSQEQKDARDAYAAGEQAKVDKAAAIQAAKDAKKAKRDAIPKKFQDTYLKQIESRPNNLQKMAKKATMSAEEIKKAEESERAVSFLSYDLDFVFDRERQEHEAAKRIQKSWMKIGRLKPWKNIIKNMLAARTIQRFAKGMITRKWVARWYNVRNITVVAIQACIRMKMSNLKVKPILVAEWAASIQIQRICRGKFGRLKAARAKYQLASIHIQACWRGAVARARSDKLWLNRIVIPIQTMVRGYLARINTGGDRSELDKCAMIIQCKFRSFVAIRKVTRMLTIRENEYRMDNIAQLTAEEEYIQERIEKMIRRLLRKDFQGEAGRHLKAMLDSQQDIYDLENDVVEMNRQMEILSPRAIVQGYYQEINGNCNELRDRTTAKKIHNLFTLTPPVREVDNIVDLTMAEIEKTAATRGKLSLWRDLEYADRRERSYQKELLERARNKRMAIAAERRRWQVLYFTPDGKPDKRRKPGRPWDKTIYAGDERQTYHGGANDILGEMPDNNKTKPGSDESIKQTLNQMSLQTYLQEVNAYEELLNPITSIMQNTVAAPMGKPAPEDLGWGQEGKKLAPAMWTIGAAPASWHRPLSPGGSTALSSKEILALEVKRADEAEEEARRQEELALEAAHKAEVEASAKMGWKKLRSATASTSALKRAGIAQNMRKPKGYEKSYNLASPDARLKSLRDAAEAERKREIARERIERAEKRRAAKAKKRLPPVTIPWSLLDALEGEKKKFENEKAYMEMHHKI